MGKTSTRRINPGGRVKFRSVYRIITFGKSGGRIADLYPNGLWPFGRTIGFLANRLFHFFKWISSNSWTGHLQRTGKPVMKGGEKEHRNPMRYLAFFAAFLVMSSFLISCQSSGSNTRFGNPLITADIRYLMSNGELSGTWSFFQRNQVDSLVPDARLHEFIINGQKITSDKVANYYHMYMVGDTLISQNLNVQIQPENEVVSIPVPLVPRMESDSLITGRDWVFTWNQTAFESGDSITLVLSDTLQQTVLIENDAQVGEMTIPEEKTVNLEPGKGYYYLISKERRKKVVNNVDFKYAIEVYSDNVPIQIFEGGEFMGE